MKQGLLRSLVYIITSLKVVISFRANSREFSENMISSKASIDPGKATTIIPAIVRVYSSLLSIELERISFKLKNNIIFIYQLQQIKGKGIKATTSIKLLEFLLKVVFLNKSRILEDIRENIEIKICDL